MMLVLIVVLLNASAALNERRDDVELLIHAANQKGGADAAHYLQDLSATPPTPCK
jgi:hypothetical protein